MRPGYALGIALLRWRCSATSAADRPSTGADDIGVDVYDKFEERQTTMPAADAPDPSRADVMLGYFDDDQPRSVTQGDTSTVFTLDANAPLHPDHDRPLRHHEDHA
ncbi:hypothetical protein, partial [Knoellia remsis]